MSNLSGLPACPVSALRSVKWRMSFQLLPEVPVTERPAMWSESLRNQRCLYETERNELTKSPSVVPSGASPVLDNPLSTEANSQWNQFHRDQELLDTINKDVERLFPRDLGDLFQRTGVADVVRKVLFVWSKANADISYRQGMHELLAPLVWVLLHDADLLENPSEVLLGVGGETMVASTPEQIRMLVADPRFVEHDSYAMFAELMKVREFIGAVVLNTTTLRCV
jgi:TBC1 domain family protein 5